MSAAPVHGVTVPRLVLVSGRTGEFSLRNAPQDGNAGVAQNVLDHNFSEARGVVVKVEPVVLFVDAESLQPIRIGEVAERAVLLGLELVLEFVCDGHECHGGDYNILGERTQVPASTAITILHAGA
jgi:hypothetical protein